MLKEEVQESGVMLANRDNMIDNLLVKIHELQL
jgi:hypothetical protein